MHDSSPLGSRAPLASCLGPCSNRVCQSKIINVFMPFLFVVKHPFGSLCERKAPDRRENHAPPAAICQALLNTLVSLQCLCELRFRCGGRREKSGALAEVRALTKQCSPSQVVRTEIMRMEIRGMEIRFDNAPPFLQTLWPEMNMPVNRQSTAWTAGEEALLGTKSDKRLAKQLEAFARGGQGAAAALFCAFGCT